MTLKNIGVYSVIVLASFIFLGPIISTHQWFYSQTQDYYPYLMEMIKDSVSHGVWYPRWLPNLAGGYGYPLMLYYHPGFLFLTLPFTYVLPVVYAFYASMLLTVFIGGLGAYKLGRLYCNRPASLLCMGLFLTSHYLAINVFLRGDLPEFAAMLLCPWGIYCLIRLMDGIHRRTVTLGQIAAFTLVTFVMAIMHPFVFMYCAPIALALLIGKWVESRYNPNIIIVPCLCIAIALALSSPYWLTALQMKEFVRYRSGTFITERAKNLAQFFNDDYFASGKIQFTLSILGWLCGLRQVVYRYVFAIYCCLIFLLTPYADFIWHMHTPLSYTQFPWRINSVLATLQLMGMIQLARVASPYVERLHAPCLKTAVWTVAIVALLPLFVVNVHGKYKEPFNIWNTIDYDAYKKQEEKGGFRYLVIYREFNPVTADYDNLPNRLAADVPIVESAIASNATIVMDPASSDYMIRFTVITAGNGSAPLDVRINQMFMPGWQVIVDGLDAPFATNDAAKYQEPTWGIGDHGRVRVHFPEEGTYKVVAWYDGPPGWRMRNGIIVILLLVLFYALYGLYRQLNAPEEKL